MSERLGSVTTPTGVRIAVGDKILVVKPVTYGSVGYDGRIFTPGDIFEIVSIETDGPDGPEVGLGAGAPLDTTPLTNVFDHLRDGEWAVAEHEGGDGE